MVIGTVVEGPTDRLVLEAILTKLLPGEHDYRPIQPGQTFGELGTGWKGVRRWCRQTWQRADLNLNLIVSDDADALLDLLVIHVDADVAFESDLQQGEDEPKAGPLRRSFLMINCADEKIMSACGRDEIVRGIG